jgi:hypothetical protein
MMANEQLNRGIPAGEIWHEVAADPEIMAREREIADMREFLKQNWNEDTASAVRNLQQQNAIDVLQKCGIPPEDIVKAKTYERSKPHIARVGFKRNGMQHTLTLNGEQTEVMAWDERVGDRDGWLAAHAYLVCRTSGYHPDDANLPANLSEYVWQTLRSVTTLKDAGTFNEKYGFINFTLDSPRSSWALPVAIGITDMPLAEAVRITGPAERGEYNPHLRPAEGDTFWEDRRFMTVPGPGTLVAEAEDSVVWRLDTRGGLRDAQPLAADPMSQALLRLLGTMR